MNGRRFYRPQRPGAICLKHRSDVRCRVIGRAHCDERPEIHEMAREPRFHRVVDCPLDDPHHCSLTAADEIVFLDEAGPLNPCFRSPDQGLSMALDSVYPETTSGLGVDGADHINRRARSSGGNG